MIFLYTNNELSEKGVKKWLLLLFLRIASKINQILATDLIKEEKEL